MCLFACVGGWLQSELVGELAEKEEAVLSLKRQLSEVQENAEVRRSIRAAICACARAR